jgi:mitogen-activated protein kinase 1/3
MDKDNKVEVAIKKINNIFEHHIYALRCLRELKILRLMDHPNIVTIKEILIPEKEDYEDM